jgi:hypothetical protein
MRGHEKVSKRQKSPPALKTMKLASLRIGRTAASARESSWAATCRRELHAR